MTQLNLYLRNISGVAAVEFALLIPILLALLIGIVDFGFYLNHKMKLESIARASAEYLIATRDEDTVFENVVIPYYDNLGDPLWQSNFDIETQMICTCGGGDSVECEFGVCEDEGDYKRRFYDVAVSNQHDTFFPYPSLPDFLNLTGNARMQLD